MVSRLSPAVCALLLTGCIGGQVGVIPVTVPVAKDGPREWLGVDVTVSAGSWAGQPELDQEITAVRAAIVNRTGHPVRIRYADLALVGGDHETLTALPPFRLRGAIQNAFNPSISGSRFLVAKAYAAYFPGWAVDETAPFDDAGYDRAFRQWHAQLPTPDMVNQALPEGLLRDGGRIEGYVFFARPLQPDPEATFVARLLDARSGRPIGKISIPLGLAVATQAGVPPGGRSTD